MNTSKFVVHSSQETELKHSRSVQSTYKYQLQNKPSTNISNIKEISKQAIATKTIQTDFVYSGFYVQNINSSYFGNDVLLTFPYPNNKDNSAL